MKAIRGSYLIGALLMAVILFAIGGMLFRPSFAPRPDRLDDTHMRAESIAVATAYYVRDVGVDPPFDGRLSKILFGDNSLHVVYLERSPGLTNSEGLFVDWKNRPFSVVKVGEDIFVKDERHNVRGRSSVR